MTKLRPLFAVASVLALAACATTPRTPGPPAPPSSTNTFRAEDFAASAARGTATVTGRVAYRDWTCAGGSVGLTPDTPYSRGRIQRLYGSTTSAVRTVEEVRSRQVAEAGGDYSRYVRTVQCDTQERFRFEDLPAGSWFVIGRARAKGASANDGVVLMRRVQTRAGQTATVELK